MQQNILEKSPMRGCAAEAPCDDSAACKCGRLKQTHSVGARNEEQRERENYIETEEERSSEGERSRNSGGEMRRHREKGGDEERETERKGHNQDKPRKQRQWGTHNDTTGEIRRGDEDVNNSYT